MAIEQTINDLKRLRTTVANVIRSPVATVASTGFFAGNQAKEPSHNEAAEDTLAKVIYQFECAMSQKQSVRAAPVEKRDLPEKSLQMKKEYQNRMEAILGIGVGGTTAKPR